MQMIEIAKAFSYNAKIVIMDEPTSSLSEKEGNIFSKLFKIKDRGCGIIYISHKMDEIFKFGSEITILRDGKIGSIPFKLKAPPWKQIVSMMVGRELTTTF